MYQINQINNEILIVENLTNYRIEKFHHCKNKQIRFVTGTASINTQINISIIYEVFDLETGERIRDTSINKDVEIYLDGNLIGTETILSGQGNIEFESAEVGTYKIAVENYSCEVIVQ